MQNDECGMMNLNQKIMSIENLKLRFKIFAIEVANLIKGIKSNTINNAYCNQLIRSSSSSAANYYAACRGKSKADFINKLKIVEVELDESVFFLTYFNTLMKINLQKLKN
jgi:four helix bundle protein